MRRLIDVFIERTNFYENAEAFYAMYGLLFGIVGIIAILFHANGESWTFIFYHLPLLAVIYFLHVKSRSLIPLAHPMYKQVRTLEKMFMQHYRYVYKDKPVFSKPFVKNLNTHIYIFTCEPEQILKSNLLSSFNYDMLHLLADPELSVLVLKRFNNDKETLDLLAKIIRINENKAARQAFSRKTEEELSVIYEPLLRHREYFHRLMEVTSYQKHELAKLNIRKKEQIIAEQEDMALDDILSSSIFKKAKEEK